MPPAGVLRAGVFRDYGDNFLKSMDKSAKNEKNIGNLCDLEVTGALA